MDLPRGSQPCPRCSWDSSSPQTQTHSETLLSKGTRKARGWEGGCKAGAQEGCNGRDQNREGNSIFRRCPTNSAQRDDKKPISSDRHPNPQPSCISIFERHCFQQGGIFPSRFARRDSNGLNTNFPALFNSFCTFSHHLCKCCITGQWNDCWAVPLEQQHRAGGLSQALPSGLQSEETGKRRT